MKWFNWFSGLLVTMMVVWVVAVFFQAAIYIVPILISLAVWYLGYDEIPRNAKLLAAFLLLGITVFDAGPLLTQDVLNFDAWVIIVVGITCPALLMLFAYSTRKLDFERTIPVLSFLAESIDRAYEIKRSVDEYPEEEGPEGEIEVYGPEQE